MAFEGDVIAYADQGLGSDDQTTAAQNNFIVQNKFLKFILVETCDPGMEQRRPVPL